MADKANRVFTVILGCIAGSGPIVILGLDPRTALSGQAGDLMSIARPKMLGSGRSMTWSH